MSLKGPQEQQIAMSAKLLAVLDWLRQGLLMGTKAGNGLIQTSGDFQSG